jgi:hypothetical protein
LNSLLSAQELWRILGKGIHEGKALPLHDRIRSHLAGEFLQLWFVVEQIQLARCPGHEQEDNVLDLRREIRRLGSHRIDRLGIRAEQFALIQQRRESDLSQPEAAAVEEMAPRFSQQ